MEANHSDLPTKPDPIPGESLDPKTTPFDYIVVGSGPGGGPLACRLARSGMKVLVLEAGLDPGAPLPENEAPQQPKEKFAAQRTAQNERLIYHCPGLHAAATEPHEYTRNNPAITSDDAMHTSWAFDVKHYSSPVNPSYYPRASALGGCAAHHAMISIYGADYDWQRIADLTGDDSWASGKMRAIYQRIERARHGVLGGRLAYFLEWFLNWLDPARNASAERGDSGWLEIRMSDPKLAMRDRRLMKVITKTVFDEEGLSNRRVFWRWIKRFFSGMLFRDLDLNDEQTMRESPEGVALVPIAVTQDGVRRGPREWLLETRRELPPKTPRERQNGTDPFTGELHIATNVFVRRVIFDCEEKDVPRAIGVEFECGRHLYEASPFFKATPPREKYYCFARREIVLCGGAFNTPQMLMLSGIGEKQHLRDNGGQRIACIKGGKAHDHVTWEIINLPGVGQNLLDRCEISVISEMEDPFESLKGVEFDPNATSDPALDAWKAGKTLAPRAGIYTTNGAALAILKRSRESVVQPDLLMFGFPVAFRGYYKGWSKDLLARTQGDQTKNRSLWSWVILKAYSLNCGSVRLQSREPSKVPAINFRYFGDCWDAKQNQWNIHEKDDDLDALKYAVRFVRGLNRKASKLMKGGDAAAAEIQPGMRNPDGSADLQNWIVEKTWGHHAAGTCRIGADPWREDPAALKDKGAVLDSKFRVHGVRGLRVVDASVFPKIPGYFIVVAIYIISEKAADTILDELSF